MTPRIMPGRYLKGCMVLQVRTHAEWYI